MQLWCGFADLFHVPPLYMFWNDGTNYSAKNSIKP